MIADTSTHPPCIHRPRDPVYDEHTSMPRSAPVGYFFDQKGNMHEKWKAYNVSVLRSLSNQARLNSASLQWLTYKYDCFLAVRDCVQLHSNHYFGLKHHPWWYPEGMSMDETEFCECCPSPYALLHSENDRQKKTTKLYRHWRTLTHLAKKYDVDKKDLKENAELVRIKLRMMGINVQN
tara:strand:- start:130 stop:666 length:537 start_codon:yes stop_codon:yes gene_type:complete